MSGPVVPGQQSLSTLTLAMLSVLVLVLVSGFVVLIVTDHDTSGYVLFVAGPLVTTVVGGLLGQRVKVVEDVVKHVEAQTNGLLTAKLDQLHEHIEQQTVELSGESVAGVVATAGSSGVSSIPAQSAPAAAQRDAHA